MAEGSDGKYAFSKDMFTRCIPVWKDVLAPWRGRPDVRYLEVGVFEGAAVLWMLANVLTHPTARATCVDAFFGDYERRFRDNLQSSGGAGKVDVVKGLSHQALRALALDSFDIVYIDAAIFAEDVLISAALGWDLLKRGGLLIFDDYRWAEGECPEALRPSLAINAFLGVFQDSVDVVHKGYQLMLRKKENVAKKAFLRLLMAGPVSEWKRSS